MSVKLFDLKVGKFISLSVPKLTPDEQITWRASDSSKVSVVSSGEKDGEFHCVVQGRGNHGVSYVEFVTNKARFGSRHFQHLPPDGFVFAAPSVSSMLDADPLAAEIAEKRKKQAEEAELKKKQPESKPESSKEEANKGK